MSQTFEVRYDGTTLYLDEPLNLSPNSRVRITVEEITEKAPASFLTVAMGIKLDGPADWSANLGQLHH